MKLLKNKERDSAARRKLRSADWKVLVVWECQTRDLEKLAKTLITFLGGHKPSGLQHDSLVLDVERRTLGLRHEIRSATH